MQLSKAGFYSGKREQMWPSGPKPSRARSRCVRDCGNEVAHCKRAVVPTRRSAPCSQAQQLSLTPRPLATRPRLAAPRPRLAAAASEVRSHSATRDHVVRVLQRAAKRAPALAAMAAKVEAGDPFAKVAPRASTHTPQDARGQPLHDLSFSLHTLSMPLLPGSCATVLPTSLHTLSITLLPGSRATVHPTSSVPDR